MPYIDWTFFFAAWELKGRFPAILDHPQYGAGGARAVRQRARRCSIASSPSRLLTARGVYGFWPAASDGDDIVVYRGSSARGELLRFNMLRQQEADRRRQAEPVAGRFRGRSRDRGAPTTSARSPSPPASAPTTLARAVRARRTTTTAPSWSRRWPTGWPRRLRVPARARARRSGASRETRDARGLIAEHHRGIRPGSAIRRARITARSSSCSSCSTRARSASTLTEHAAMTPAASVSGLYFAPSAGALFHGRPGRRGPDRRATPAARACRSRRSSDG